jgi:hypothetical protein
MRPSEEERTEELVEALLRYPQLQPLALSGLVPLITRELGRLRLLEKIDPGWLAAFGALAFAGMMVVRERIHASAPSL